MKRLLTAVALLLAALTLPACAHTSRLVDVQVVDQDTGQTLPHLPYRGRDYLEGQPGHRFALSMRNLTGERVLVVVSVDGVNVVSGETAGSNQAGYVLDPWQQMTVRGWRKSYSDIAEFYFTDLPDSYAARTGRAQNVGVIGVAAFRERRPEPLPAPMPSVAQAQPYAPPMAEARDEAPMAKSAEVGSLASNDAARERSDAPRAAQQLGAGHGERRYDPVTRTEFQRDSIRPAQLVALYYDAHDALVARGVIPRHVAPSFVPDPFPIGFVQDPSR